MYGRLLSLLLLAAQPVFAQPAPDPAELERIDAAIASVQAELAATRTERSALLEQLQSSEKAILDVQKQMAAVTAAIGTEERKLEALRAQQQTLELKRREQQAMIASYVKSAWMAGNGEYLKLLLNQEDPLKTARVMRYYRYFNSARSARLAEYNETLAGMAALEADVRAANAQLELRQSDLAGQQRNLMQNLEQRQQTLGELDRILSARDQELQQLEQEKIEVEILLEELRRSIADIALGDDQQPFAERKGKMAWPLEGRLVNTFGSRHELGDLTWEGVTIAGPVGADVRAIHHGRVIFADWFSNSGLLLIIDHGDGYMSLYAHNQELYKAVGEWVASGDVIAAVGNTGGQRDYGLYFEIRRNGKAENPVNWCVARN